jgi:peptide/nickel transport system ATP-binding protein
MNPLLHIGHLSVSFHSPRAITAAVKGISFDLERGESLGIVGESGSGKSLTALSLLRLTDYLPSCHMEAGALKYFPEPGREMDIASLNPAGLTSLRGSEIGMIFQDPATALNPVFTVGEQIGEVLRTHKGLDRRAARETVKDWLNRVQLTDLERIYASYPHQLSGGQKQRVSIAMALAAEPRLLIADEPTTALDVTVQKKILELLRQLRADLGMSLLFISHDLGVVSEMTERVLVMKSGEIVEEGEVDTLFHHSSQAYTRQLLNSRPPLEVRLRRLPVTGAAGPAEVLSENDIGGRAAHFAAQPPLLEVEGLSVRYRLKKGFLQAVDQVSLSVAPGETLGIVGESGCGKTTLGKAIVRLVDAQEGRVTFDGQDILGLSERAWRQLRRRTQVIFQDPYHSLNPRITIGKAILEPLQVHGIGASDAERKDRLTNWLERVGMDGSYALRYPHELSGGQRQRAGIARALAIEPSLLIADECVSALDVSVQAQILNLLLDLQADTGFAMLFISHDWAVVRFVSDRVMVMREGKVLETGLAGNIWQNPAHPYTRELIHAIPGRKNTR